jgi:DUF971 family protein
MHLTKLIQESSTELMLSWDDAHSGPVSLRNLRDSCPCAGCKGETVLFRTYVPPPATVKTPGRYELKGADAVGGYAMKFSWGDGHNLGIYTWEHLRSLCECEECAEKRSETPG